MKSSQPIDNKSLLLQGLLPWFTYLSGAAMGLIAGYFYGAFQQKKLLEAELEDVLHKAIASKDHQVAPMMYQKIPFYVSFWKNTPSRVYVLPLVQYKDQRYILFEQSFKPSTQGRVSATLSLVQGHYQPAESTYAVKSKVKELVTASSTETNHLSPTTGLQSHIFNAFKNSSERVTSTKGDTCFRDTCLRIAKIQSQQHGLSFQKLTNLMNYQQQDTGSMMSLYEMRFEKKDRIFFQMNATQDSNGSSGLIKLSPDNFRFKYNNNQVIGAEVNIKNTGWVPLTLRLEAEMLERYLTTTHQFSYKDEDVYSSMLSMVSS